MANLVFCLMGPTASGKTALACELVERFPCEIISVDSALIYRGMNIGTAKPDAQTLARAPHHLVDILDPPESYSAAQFCEDTRRLCDAILAKGKIPLLAGGTMMYFRALQQGMSILPESDAGIRMMLAEEESANGLASMHARLMQCDPESAARIHANDTQRIYRALEVYALTGKSMSACLSGGTKPAAYRFVNALLMPKDRAWLHARIALRFTEMLDAGLLDEVAGLLKQWPQLTREHPAMRCVGYRQAFEYLQGEYDEATLCEKGIAATRQLAKRQLTWLRHWPDVTCFEAENPAIVAEIRAVMRQCVF